MVKFMDGKICDKGREVLVSANLDTNYNDMKPGFSILVTLFLRHLVIYSHNSSAWLAGY